MSLQTVARRYASALADVIISRGEQAEIQKELVAWEQMMLTNPLLMEAFGNPTIAYDQKVKVLEELIKRTKVRPTSANFLRLLLKNQRLAELPYVNAKLAAVLDERGGVVSAQVTSARPVSDPTKTQLEAKLAEVTGKRMRLSFSTDPSLIGGIVTRIGSTVYDGSVRNQLKRLSEELAG